jgi:hypothetical protein
MSGELFEPTHNDYYRPTIKTFCPRCAFNRRAAESLKTAISKNPALPQMANSSLVSSEF